MRYFVDIVGYEEVASGRQKPAPDGLLLCISRIRAPLGEGIFFIGDHESDTLCGYNANKELRKRMLETRVVNVAACYASRNDTSFWKVKPDHVVCDPKAIPDYIERYQQDTFERVR